MSLFDVRSAADVRALVHVAAPVLASAAIASGWLEEGVAQLIVTLILAVASPAIATLNTANGFRQFFYPVAAAVAALLIYLGWLSDAQWAIWLPVLTVFIGPAVAAANTPTSAATGATDV